jgi:DNA helicase HerA-like ATPase
MYSTFMLWMMSELFEALPESGDRDKPKMVFFFDEAHLLFKSASKTLLEKIEQVVKLIRSKGVGIYFITQSPKDIPDGVLGQLGNKIQHALHSYTPAEQKAAKVAAQSFRANPEFDTYEALTQLGIGEALVSVLDENGVPTIVKKCSILPPQSQMGVLDDVTRKQQITGNLLYTKYAQMIDRESAYELLEKMVTEELAARETAERTAKEEAAAAKEAQKREAAQKRGIHSTVKKVASSATGTIGREIGNQIGQSIGGSFGKRLGGNVGASLGRGILSTLFK